MKNVKELIPYIIIVIVIVLLRIFIITPIQVVGDSMSPTLENGNILLLSKGLITGGKYNRFDIVVIKYNEETIIKRVIGLPGEKIEYIDNTLYVDGEIVKEDFSHDSTSDFSISELGNDKVPDDSYLVLGDNRGISLDSRRIGFIKKEDISGKVCFRLFPFNKFGFAK